MVDNGTTEVDLQEALTRGLPEVEVNEIRLPVEEYQGSKILKAIMLSGQGGPIETAESAQLDLEIDRAFQELGSQIIEPPFSPALWSLTPEQNTRLARAVNAWARNTVGLGWKIVPKDAEGNVLDKEELAGGKQAQFDRERKILQNLFKFPNPSMPFTRLMYLVKWDEEATGNGYLEVVRNAKGEIVSLYHIPSHSIRILQEGRALVQIRGMTTTDDSFTSNISASKGKSNIRYFKFYGDPQNYNRYTGKKATARLGSDKRATEILHFKVYTPRSQYYGAPRYVSTAPSITGNRLAAERNVHFFDNDAVPRGLLFVEGGHLDAGSIQRIENFVRHKVRGPENAGRLLILQLQPKRTGMPGEANRESIRFQPLTVGVTEDASFLAYRAANDEEVRESMGLAESFFRTDMVNRASAEIGRATTNEQEFEPDRLDKEFIINHTIVTDQGWTGGPLEVAQLEFRRPTIADPVDLARVNSLYASAGALTPNDLRRELGRDPFPEEFKFADKPLVWALAELQAGQTGLNGDEENAPPGAEELAEIQANAKADAENKTSESGGRAEPESRVGGASSQNLRTERATAASVSAEIERLRQAPLEVLRELAEEAETHRKSGGSHKQKGEWHY